MSQFTRDALLERIEKLEAKFRQEEALALADGQKRRGLVPLHSGFKNNESLAPKPLKGLNEPNEDLGDENLLESTYRHHATLIVAALTNPTEKRLRVAEALAAIRNETPITEPPESEILATLEKYVLALRTKNPTVTPTQSMKSTDTMNGFMQGFTSAMAETDPLPISPLPVSRFASPMTGKKITDTKK